MKKNHDRRSPNARILRLENLETRELLSVTTAELGPVASDAVADAALPAAPIPLGALVVDTTLDVVDPSDGVLSLREAIQNANDGDTISFDSCLAGETITLSGTQLEIDKAIAIDASALSTDGSPAITIDANRQSRVLYVHADAQSSGVALKGLTIANGLVSGHGGGINLSGKLKLDSCYVSGNEATEYEGFEYMLDGVSTYNVMKPGKGGGIMIDSTGDLTLNNCVVSNNKAYNGAGVCDVNGKVVASAVDFTGNVASSWGGGLYMGDGTESVSSVQCLAKAELDSCAFSNNASSDGGAILNEEGTLSVVDCVFSENTAQNGAAITVHAGVGSLKGSSFSGNAGLNNGGALCVRTASTVDVTSCEFVDNTAQNYGGAIFNTSSTFRAEDSSIARNSAKEGGALYNNTRYGSGSSLTNVTIANNTSTTYGGGVSARYGKVHLTVCTVADNQADKGGGLFVGGNATMIVAESGVAGNSAKTSGGGFWSSGSLTVDRCTVTENSSAEGGAMKIDTTAPVVIKNSLLANNTANSGGAISCLSLKVTADFYNTTIANNTAGSYGGIVTKGKFNLYNSIVAGNKTKSGSVSDVTPLSTSTASAAITAYNTLSSFSKWTAGSDNLKYDASKPLFANAANGDYRLAADSQAIDKGSVDYVVSDYDLAGEPRTKDASVDLGAYEYEEADARALTLKAYNRNARQAVMEWDAIPGAATYLFKISKDGGKTRITYARNFTNTNKSVNGIYAGKSYSFRVFGVDANGKSLGSYIEKTIEPINIVATDKPYVVNTGKLVTLQAYNPSAVSIRWYQVTDTGLVEIEDVNARTSYASPDGEYELKVVATGRDGTNSEGFVSELYIGRPTASINISAQNTMATAVNASWKEVPGAASYLVKISRDGGETWITKKKDITSNIVLLTSVADGNQFRVYAFDANGRQMKSIAQSTFDAGTLPTKDDPLVFCDVNKSKTAATLKWLPIKGAVTYKVLVSRDDGVTWLTKRKDLTDTSAAVGDINGVTPFRVCGYDKYGARLDAYYQASIDGPSLSNPIVFTDVNADQTSATLRWIPIDGAATYKIRVSKDGGATWVDYVKYDYPQRTLRGIESGYQFRVYGFDSTGKIVSGSREITFQPSSASLLDEAFADYFAEF